MARIEWVKLRLENWALWCAREASGGMGFYSQSSFLNDAATDRYRESNILLTVDGVDAELTNQAVESLRSVHSHLYATLRHIYVDDLGVKACARQMAVAESTIRARLDDADRVLRQWFDERQQRLQLARAR